MFRIATDVLQNSMPTREKTFVLLPFEDMCERVKFYLVGEIGGCGGGEAPKRGSTAALKRKRNETSDGTAMGGRGGEGGRGVMPAKRARRSASCNIMQRAVHFLADVDGDEQKQQGETKALISFNEAVQSSAMKKLTVKDRCKIYLTVFNALSFVCEEQNITFAFSREYFRYFLATYRRFLSGDDFDNNFQRHRSRHNNESANNAVTTTTNAAAVAITATTTTSTATTAKRNLIILSNGAILNEYVNKMYLFSSNLSRCEEKDLEAIRLVFHAGIQLDYNIYRYLSWNEKFSYAACPDKYPYDHAKINIGNGKCVPVLCSRGMMLVYDGKRFVLPSVNLEREIPLKFMIAAEDGFVIYECLFIGAKCALVDILNSNVEHVAELLLKPYEERIAVLRESFSKVVNPTFQQGRITPHEQESFLLKSKGKSLDGESLIYRASPHVIAAVGYRGKEILLAYQQKADTLVYKISAPIVGIYNCIFGVQKLQREEKDCPSISFRGEHFKIEGLSVDDVCWTCGSGGSGDEEVGNNCTGGKQIHLFETVVRVDMKDGNKLGAFVVDDESSFADGEPLTNVSRYKAPLSKMNAAGKSSGSVVPKNANLPYYDKLFSSNDNIAKFMAYINHNDKLRGLLASRFGSAIDAAAPTTTAPSSSRISLNLGF